MHACMHTYIHACMHTYMHACIHTYIHACMHTYIHACMHAYIHACIHTYIHVRTHTHIYNTQRYGSKFFYHPQNTLNIMNHPAKNGVGHCQPHCHYEVYLLTSKGSKVLHADCEVHVIGGWWCWVCLDITCKQETSKMRNKDGILFLPLFFLEERSVSQTFMHWITMDHTVAGYLIYIYVIFNL